MKKQIALVSVTLNAVNPMTEYLSGRDPELHLVNYLDSYLLEKVGNEGGINDSSVRRMFDMLSTACADGADGVILTCTIFSPYVPYFSGLLSRPVVCPDGAMLDEAAGCPGRTAILCTFTGTVDITRNMYCGFRRKRGLPETVDMYVVDGAYEAGKRRDFAVHDRLIQEKIRELDGRYEQIVLAQISMAGAAAGVKAKHARVFTSPESTYQSLMKAVSGEGL